MPKLLLCCCFVAVFASDCACVLTCIVRHQVLRQRYTRGAGITTSWGTPLLAPALIKTRRGMWSYPRVLWSRQ